MGKVIGEKGGEKELRRNECEFEFKWASRVRSVSMLESKIDINISQSPKRRFHAYSGGISRRYC